MKWTNLFNIYNRKLVKNKKLLFLVTTLSIFLAVIISLTIPQVEHQSRDYLEKNMKAINGGDLRVKLQSNYDNKNFLDEIEKMKNEGLEVNTVYNKRAYCILNSNKIATEAFIGDYDLKDDEVIVGESLSKSSKLKKGDKISLSIKGAIDKDYTIKEIEHQEKGVSSDDEILGYFKVRNSGDIDVSKMARTIYISGQDGDNISDRLKNIDSSNIYTTLESRQNDVMNNEALEETSLGILSISTYIISILCIVSTISMIMFQRKRDIAILRMLSIKIGNIKKSIMLEISLWFIPAIILASVLSYPLSMIILSYKGLEYSEGILWTICFIGKNFLFNIFTLYIIAIISLQIIACMRQISILKNDGNNELRRKFKKVLLESVLSVPVIIILYCIISNNMGGFFGLIGLVVFCSIFVLFTCIILKFVSSIIPLKFMNLRYSFKSIKKNLFGFVLVLVSITMTLWFVLIGFYLEGAIKDNMSESIKDSLPYNYEVNTDNEDELENALDSDNDVEGYDKLYYISGTINNLDKKTPYRNIAIYEVNSDKYSAKFRMSEGENLFEGDKEGVIISDDMSKNCSLNVGDMLDVTTKNGDLKIAIKGIYKSCGINDIAVYKQNKEIGKDIEYLVNSKSSDFTKDLSNLEIYNMNDIGGQLAASLMKFLKVFKVLSIITIFSALLFNINIMNMNSSLEEKDETIIKSLGIGSRFIRKSKNIKVIIMTILTSILSVGMFNFIMSTMFKSMFNCSGSIGTLSIISVCIMAFVISFIAFSKNTVSSKVNLELLRND